MPSVEKEKKVRRIGGSDMVALPRHWKDYWDIKEKRKNNRGKKRNSEQYRVDIYVNSLLVIVPRSAKNYKQLTQKARDFVEGKMENEKK